MSMTWAALLLGIVISYGSLGWNIRQMIVNQRRFKSTMGRFDDMLTQARLAGYQKGYSDGQQARAKRAEGG